MDIAEFDGDRIIIREGYRKLYEIHHKEVPLSGLDYILGQRLTEEKVSQLVLEIIKWQKEL